MLRDLIRFAIRRDSESAMLLVIPLAHYMNSEQLLGMAQYLQGLRDDKFREGSK